MSDPFIPIANTYIGAEEAQAVFDTVKSGWISMGPKVKELETLIAAYLGVKHALTFNNGTSSLHASLQALGVGPGDEVLVPTLSYASSANVVLFCGATPVFMESEPDTFNVSAEEIARRITPRTKAIMTVDLKGMPVDFDAILAVARRHGLPVLSDSAESFGAIYRGRKVGSQAPVHSFSFFANKNITMGEGGLVTTEDDRLADLIRTIRNQGQSERYVHVVIGNNYRLTDLSAAFGVEQVKRAEWIMTEKGAVAGAYDRKLAGHPLIRTPVVPEYVGRHSWYMYCLTLDESVDRDGVVRRMRARGVDSRLSFPPIHLQPVYREKFGYKDGDFPRSERIFRTFIDIPCWVGMDGGMIDRVVDAVSVAVEQARR
jgi:perosamine synthetase